MPGLVAGAYVLPPFLTGAPSIGDLDPSCSLHCVYVTPSLDEATVYAGLRHGDVYEVEPRGKIEREHELSTVCTAAVVVRVVVRGVTSDVAGALMQLELERLLHG